MIFGIFILWRLKRFDLALSFLITYFLIHIFIEISKKSSANEILNLFINGSTIFFFAMFMLIEPRTNPAARKQRIFYGVLVAFMLIGIETYNPTFGIPFVLAAANLCVPLLNRISFEVRKKISQPSNKN